MIRHTRVHGVKHHNTTFKDSKLAHQYLDHLTGIEIGAAAHNGFRLPNCQNVGLRERDRTDFDFYREAQVQMCGSYAEIDIEGEAHAIPVADDSQEFVLTSHVIEHVADPIRVFLEWTRILKPNGIIFMIFPHRDAHPPDRKRPLSTIGEFTSAYEEAWTPDTVPEDVHLAAGGRRGHYWVMSLESMLKLIDTCNILYGMDWQILETHMIDDKVSNGHTIVARYVPQI